MVSTPKEAGRVGNVKFFFGVWQNYFSMTFSLSGKACDDPPTMNV
jgi:hypothetical protein